MYVCEANIHQSEFCPPPSVKICLGRYSLCVCLFQIVIIILRDPIRDFVWPCFGVIVFHAVIVTLFRGILPASMQPLTGELMKCTFIYFSVTFARAWSPGTSHSPWLVVSLIVFRFRILMSLLFRYWTLILPSTWNRNHNIPGSAEMTTYGRRVENTEVKPAAAFYLFGCKM